MGPVAADGKRAERFGWAMFDFANSSYTTAIITVYFPTVFTAVIVGDETRGNLWWSVALSISHGLVMLTLPVVGAWMDVVGHRKSFLLASTLLTALATAALASAGPGAVALAMVFVVVSNYGFACGESFIASFLPDLGRPEELGRISGAAWGLGYFGGLFSTILVTSLGAATLDNPNVRWAGPIVGLWFVLASVPTFWLLKDRAVPRPLPTGTSWMTAGFAQLARTAREAGRYRDLLLFLVGHTFAMAGLSIVFSFAFLYGNQVIHWSPGTDKLMFVGTQFSAFAGALGFGYLQGWLGDKRTYLLTLALWCVAVALMLYTPQLAAGAEAAIGRPVSAEHVYLAVGAVAGLCIGSTQSAARTLVALLSPPDRMGEFFGLWGMFGRIAAIIGLMSIGLLQAAIGLENAIVVTGLYFFLGLLVTAAVNVERGRAAVAR